MRPNEFEFFRLTSILVFEKNTFTRFFTFHNANVALYDAAKG